MLPYLIVGLAGITGALLRYGIGLAVIHDGVSSIWATLPINLIGSYALAAFLCYSEDSGNRLHPWLKAGFGTGFLGAFTTFSTFSMETVHFMLTGLYLYACLYAAVSLFGGLGAAWLGWMTVNKLRLSPDAGEGGGGR